MLGSAVDNAIEERTRKGRTEVRVEHIDGSPWFGTWRAASITSTTHHRRHYRVQLRSLTRRWNYCTCPDFAINQLGTCKHIEAVLHKVSKRPDYARLKRQPAPMSYVYLAWDSADAPRIRLHRSAALEADLGAVLERWFDAAGEFAGRLPDDYFRFTEEVDERDDIHLGEDAEEHVRRLAEDAAQHRRAAGIRDQIVRSGGQLDGVRARLYPYQVEGVAFLAANGRALLADDMGLGKTLQAIAASVWLLRNAAVKHILIVCPASLKQQWAREIQRFSGQTVEVIQGNAEARAAQYRREASFFVANYELVLRDLSYINTDLAPDLLILDEAQRIKNWRTKIASTIKLIPSRYAFVLTGTPLENRLEDLYSLMQVVDPRVLGPLWRYMIDFHVTDERGKVLGYRNLSELRRRIAPVMLRRDRSLVREQLPDRIEQRLDVPLTPLQQDLHDGALTAAGRLARIAKRRPLTPSEQNRLMSNLQTARMACDAAGLVDKQTEGSPKLDELTDLLEELCLGMGLKAVVFSQWERMTAMVEQRLKGLGLGYVRLHGGVPTAKRGALMDRFREDPATQVFVSTDAGGVGLNLQSASVLINLDVPWNPAVLDQRIARVHRLGQTNKVQVILMVAEDSYEERVMGLVQGKRELFDNVVDADASVDVVGISKRLLQTLMEDLEGAKAGDEAAQGNEQANEHLDGQAATDAESGLVEAPTDTAPAQASQPDAAARQEATQRESAEDAAVNQCVEEVQMAFGPRIERILGAGGGLLVVVDRVDAEAEAMAAELSQAIPVALIEPRTLRGLQRLGAASPVAEARTLFQAGEGQGDGRLPLLLGLAKEKLQAAELLVEQQCNAAAAELLASVLLACAGVGARLSQPPGVEEAGVWVYAEALPKGLLSPDQATALLRAIAVSQAPSIPVSLLEQVVEDARRWVAQQESRVQKDADLANRSR